MSDLAILVAAAAAGFGVSHWLRLPVIPLLVLLGFLVSRCGVQFDPGALQDLMALGLAFLLYSAGIELNPRRFEGRVPSVLWTAALQFAVMAVCGYTLALLLGFGTVSAVYLGVAIATSSTFVVIRQLQKRVGALRAYGRLAIGVLLVQDLAIMVVIVILVFLPEGGTAVAGGVGAVALMGGVAFVAQHWIFPRLAMRLALDDETVLLLLLAVLFVFAGVADAMRLPFVVGAFFAGFSLSSFPVNGVARSLLGSLSSFFLAIFFTALGARVELPEPALLVKASAFVLLVIVVTPPLVTAVAEWKGKLSSRNAITSGLLLAQTSEFSLVLGLYAVHLARIPEEVMSVIAIAAVTTMTITPLIASDGMARRLLNFHPIRRRMKTETDLRDHVLVLGLGTEGMWVIKPLREAGHHVVVVDHDTVVSQHLARAGVTFILGDASDEMVLRKAGIARAKLILVSMPNVQDAARVLRMERRADVPVIVRVFEEADAREVERLGGTALLNSHASADTFMEWYEKVVVGG